MRYTTASAQELQELLKHQIVLLDGAGGTMIQRHKLAEADFRGEKFRDHGPLLQGNNDLLSLTRPDVVESIHREYLASGANILETNTFNANRISQADYALEDQVREINLAAVRCARNAVDAFRCEHPERPTFVAGAIGPTTRTCSLSPDVNNPASRAVSFDAGSVPEPGAADAQCRDGRLWVSEIRSSNYSLMPLGRDNYHIFDYALFYLNIRANVETRVNAFLSDWPQVSASSAALVQP